MEQIIFYGEHIAGKNTSHFHVHAYTTEILNSKWGDCCGDLRAI